MKREIPESRLVEAANEFVDVVRHLWAGKQSVIALNVNAAFAIELYLESLLSGWQVNTDFVVTVTTERGLELDALFCKLDASHQSWLENAFKIDCPHLCNGDLHSALKVYRRAFIDYRYSFEKEEVRTLRSQDAVSLAEFFAKAINSMQVVRIDDRIA